MIVGHTSCRQTPRAIPLQTTDMPLARCLLSCLLAAPLNLYAATPAVLIIDDQLGTLGGGRWPAHAEMPVQDPQQARWPTAQAFEAMGEALAARLRGVQNWPGGYAEKENAYTDIRNSSIEPLRSLAVEGKWLSSLWNNHLRLAAEAAGVDVKGFFVGRDAGKGYVERAAGRSSASSAWVIKRAYIAPTRIGWDDRHVEILFRSQRFDSSLGRFREVRDVQIAYLGAMLSETELPLSSWLADDARLLRAEIELGVSRSLELAFIHEMPAPASAESDITMLPWGGEPREFRGRLWKRDGRLAYLVNDRGDLFVVHTDGAADPETP